jgi:hypothetical protein
MRKMKKGEIPVAGYRMTEHKRNKDIGEET